MASDNETVADAIAAERRHIECAKADAEEDLEIECAFTDEEVIAIIDRIEAAHKREVEKLSKRLEYVIEDSNRTCGLCEPSKKILKLQDCLKEAIEDSCASCDDEDENGCSLCRKECRVRKWRKALEGTDSGNRHE